MASLTSTLYAVARRSLYKANNILVPVDSLFMAHNDAIEPPPPLFIVGVPRSGTTLVYQAVTQQFHVGYFFETMNYLYGLTNLLMRLAKPFIGRPKPIFESQYGRTRGSFFAPAESGNFWFRWFPRNGRQGHYLAADRYAQDRYESLSRNINSVSLILDKPMVFKCVYLDMVISILARVFPEARFIFVKRDLLLTIQSLLKARRRQKDPQAWWSVKPPGYRDLIDLPLWQQITEQVFRTFQIVGRDLEEYARDRYIEIEYLEFCQDPRRIMESLVDWLGRIGYQSYSDMRVPKVFQASTELNMAPELAEKITSHLRVLEREATLETEWKK